MEFPNGMTVSRFQPKPGWQREIERDASGRITAVVWSGGKIEPAEYEDFFFIARTPQETGKLAFKAYQSYEGGETVEWVNDAEPRPAPAVTIRAAAAPLHGRQSQHRESGSGAGRGGAAAGAAAALPAPPRPPGRPPPPPGARLRHLPAPAAAQNGGSDLPLFAALVAVALALLATAMAGVALSRGAADFLRAPGHQAHRCIARSGFLHTPIWQPEPAPRRGAASRPGRSPFPVTRAGRALWRRPRASGATARALAAPPLAWPWPCMLAFLPLSPRPSSRTPSWWGPSPADGEVLQRAPERVQLFFSEPIERDFFALEVYTANRERVDRRDARIPPTNVQSLEATLVDTGPGIYTVVWRALSIDGHVVRGVFSYSVGVPGQAAGTAVLPAGWEERGAPFALGAAVRWLTYLAVAVLVGGFAFLPLVLAPALSGSVTAERALQRATRRFLWLAWPAVALLLLLTLVALVLQAVDASGGTVGEVFGGRAITRLLSGTKYGALWLGRAFLVAGLLFAVMAAALAGSAGPGPAPGGLGRSGDRRRAAAGARRDRARQRRHPRHLALRRRRLGAPPGRGPLGGGAGAAGPGPPRRARRSRTRPPAGRDRRHRAPLLGPGHGVRRRRDRHRGLRRGDPRPPLGGPGGHRLRRRPLRQAAAPAPPAGAGGGEPPPPPAPLRPPGRRRRGPTRRRRGHGHGRGDVERPQDAAGRRLFRRIVGAEVLLAVLLLGVTGILTGLPPASTAPGEGQPVRETARAGDLSVTLAVDPNQAGSNSFQVSVTDSRGVPVAAERVAAGAEPPGHGDGRPRGADGARRGRALRGQRGLPEHGRALAGLGAPAPPRRPGRGRRD